MSNRVFKNRDINFGDPFKVKNVDKLAQQYEEVEEDVESNKIEAAKNEAARIINEAKNKAKDLLDKARTDGENTKLQVQKENEKIGYDAGMKKIQDQKNKLLEEAENKKREAENLYNETAKAMEGELIKVVFNIVEKILNYEIDKNDKYIMGSIQKALYKTNDREGVKIKVSADDFEFVNIKQKEIYDMAEGLKELQIIKDNNLEKGDCLVETIYGTIDISVKKQLESVKKAFETIIKLNKE